MKIKLILILIISLIGIGSFSRAQSNKYSSTSIYFAPLSLIHFKSGSSIRVGAEQSLGKHFSIFTEWSYYIHQKPYYQDVKGYKSETGLKFNYKKIENIIFWYSMSGGISDRTFTSVIENLNTPNNTFSLSTRKTSQFLKLGIGFKVYNKNRIYLEMGILGGIQHRDLDFKGMTEDEEKNYQVKTDYHWVEGKFLKTKDAVYPDISINIRLGYYLF